MPLDSAIVFAPVGDLVPVALAALDQGGTVAVAGIHLSDIPVLQYQRHLFREKTLTSVTANTRADGEDMLRLARRHGVRATVSRYPFERADAAFDDLVHDERISDPGGLHVHANAVFLTRRSSPCPETAPNVRGQNT